MTEETWRQRSDFALIWQAAERWLPVAHSSLFQAGLTGEVIRGSGRAPFASDLTHLLIPGLAALGVHARLAALPLNGADPEILPHDSGVLLRIGFAGSLEFSPPEEINDATPLPADADPPITAQGRFQESTSDGHAPEIEDSLVAYEATLRPRFSHALHLAKSGPVRPHRASLYSALLRWLAWHAAYPERAPHEADRAELTCGPAAAFLSEASSTRHDFVSNRLRYAARCFEAAQIEDAYRWLLEAGIAVWQLPPVPAEALLTPPDLPLSDVLRRELIYLARAGTLPLKTLAAHRLTYERHHLDAHKTLHQLCFDPDPWVRAAARRLPDTQKP